MGLRGRKHVVEGEVYFQAQSILTNNVASDN